MTVKSVTGLAREKCDEYRAYLSTEKSKKNIPTSPPHSAPMMMQTPKKSGGTEERKRAREEQHSTTTAQADPDSYESLVAQMKATLEKEHPGESINMGMVKMFVKDCLRMPRLVQTPQEQVRALIKEAQKDGGSSAMETEGGSSGKQGGSGSSAK